MIHVHSGLHNLGPEMVCYFGTAFALDCIVAATLQSMICVLQTQGNQTGYVTRQLCMGAWTLLTPEPDVLEIPDCMTDFRWAIMHTQ